MKNKIINVRLPTSLYDRIKEKHRSNFSKYLRKHFQKLLDSENEQLKKFRTCFLCKNKKNFELDELFLSFPMIEEERHFTSFIVCPDCRNILLKNKEEILKGKSDDDIEAGILCILLENAQQGLLSTQAKLHQYFPDRWKLNGAVISSNCSSEEIREQLIQINKLEGLYE